MDGTNRSREPRGRYETFAEREEREARAIEQWRTGLCRRMRQVIDDVGGQMKFARLLYGEWGNENKGKVSRWYRGKSIPSPWEARRIADAVGRPVEWLLYGLSTMPIAPSRLFPALEPKRADGARLKSTEADEAAACLTQHWIHVGDEYLGHLFGILGTGEIPSPLRLDSADEKRFGRYRPLWDRYLELRDMLIQTLRRRELCTVAVQELALGLADENLHENRGMADVRIAGQSATRT